MTNSFGKIFSVTTWGESHGPAIGCVVDGVPSKIKLSEKDIQPFLDKRRPGQSKFTTQRQEADQVQIMSGVFEGKTTGHPISLIIQNTDQRSKDYGDIAQKFRPGHADYVYTEKYGIRDYRGGGRSSARETAMRVAAGAIARKIIPNIKITGGLVQMGELETKKRDWKQVDKNPFFCPDAAMAKECEKYLEKIRKKGSSIGAVIEIVASGVPLGLGEPIYGKLDAELAAAMMSINAVKGVEIGDGFGVAKLEGKQNADEMFNNSVTPAKAGVLKGKIPASAGMTGKVRFGSNHAGGILGGISTGQDVVVRFAIKPTSSILQPVKTIDSNGKNCEIITKGRHDPCVGIRAVPVGEAMMACVLADMWLRARSMK